MSNTAQLTSSVKTSYALATDPLAQQIEVATAPASGLAPTVYGTGDVLTANPVAAPAPTEFPAATDLSSDLATAGSHTSSVPAGNVIAALSAGKFPPASRLTTPDQDTAQFPTRSLAAAAEFGAASGSDDGGWKAASEPWSADSDSSSISTPSILSEGGDPRSGFVPQDSMILGMSNRQPDPSNETTDTPSGPNGTSDTLPTSSQAAIQYAGMTEGGLVGGAAPLSERIWPSDPAGPAATEGAVELRAATDPASGPNFLSETGYVAGMNPIAAFIASEFPAASDLARELTTALNHTSFVSTVKAIAELIAGAFPAANNLIPHVADKFVSTLDDSDGIWPAKAVAEQDASEFPAASDRATALFGQYAAVGPANATTGSMVTHVPPEQSSAQIPLITNPNWHG